MQTLKLEQKTISVLKNFSTINPSILFKPGKVVSTISPNKTIMAKATIDQEIEDTFAIYDLGRFLSTLSLFNDPTLEVADKYVTISSSGKKMRYGFADASVIVAPPDKEIKLPSTDVSFKLTNEALSDVLKGLGVLRLPEIAVVGDGEDINLQAIDSKNPTSDVYSISVGKTDKKFKMIFKSENIKLIPGDYDVDISAKGIGYFKGAAAEYWIAVETSSTNG
jgi:hypothetical protein